ncbi:hypothetical protein, partial [Lacimonas salitolerans]
APHVVTTTSGATLNRPVRLNPHKSRRDPFISSQYVNQDQHKHQADSQSECCSNSFQVKSAALATEMTLQNIELALKVLEVSSCRFRGHEDKIVTKESEIGNETEVYERVQV